MIKLKNILKEDEQTWNPADYKSPAQLGKTTGLDAEADQRIQDSFLSKLEQNYSRIKRARIDMAEFKNDVMDLISIYKDKPRGSATTMDFINAFLELYPYSKTYSGWQGSYRDVRDNLNRMLQHAHAIQSGDTSSYAYRVSK